MLSPFVLIKLGSVWWSGGGGGGRGLLPKPQTTQ